MELVKKALEFEERKLSLKTTNERILASREVKGLILGLNEIYKKNSISRIGIGLNLFNVLIGQYL